MWKIARQAPRNSEFKHLETRPKPFEGRVWGCRKWARCSERIIETPPYSDSPPTEVCMDHRLPMTTKTAERRMVSKDSNSA